MDNNNGQRSQSRIGFDPKLACHALNKTRVNADMERTGGCSHDSGSTGLFWLFVDWVLFMLMGFPVAIFGGAHGSGNSTDGILLWWWISVTVFHLFVAWVMPRR